jgi:hypothetical protein
MCPNHASDLWLNSYVCGPSQTTPHRCNHRRPDVFHLDVQTCECSGSSAGGDARMAFLAARCLGSVVCYGPYTNSSRD